MSYLERPLKIRNITIKNRLVMPPMATSKAIEGKIMEDHYQYYDEKSKGGYIGLIITEHNYIHENGKANTKQVSIAKDEDIEGLKLLVDTIHKNDSIVFSQINHAGSRSIGNEKISASSIKHPLAKKEDLLASEMSILQINEVIQWFVDAARRSKQAGFDGVEVHAAHGYLLNQFYSPLTNKRKDQYGGDIQNRIRILIQIIEAIRKEVGNNYPIALRLGACDYMENGSTIEDAKIAAIALEKSGVDVLDITGGMNGYVRPNNNREGYFSDASKAVKEVIKIPVVLTGGIKSRKAIEMLLKEEKADLIGVGREILKDSQWAKRCFVGDDNE